MTVTGTDGANGTNGTWWGSSPTPTGSGSTPGGVGEAKSSITGLSDVPVIGALLDGAALLIGYALEGLKTLFVLLFGNQNAKTDVKFNPLDAKPAVQVAVLQSEDTTAKVKYRAALGLINQGGSHLTREVRKDLITFLQEDALVMHLLENTEGVEDPKKETGTLSAAVVDVLSTLVAGDDSRSVVDGADVSGDGDTGDF